jgi:hypothetical protein
MSESMVAASLLDRLRGLFRGEAAAPVNAQSYLAHHYGTVPGFSSLFSAQVAAALLAAQRQAGIIGHVGEIGVLMGRSFIGLALAAGPDDLCLAIDDFTWPEHVQGVFIGNCRKYGVDMDRLVTIAANTTTLTAADILAKLDGGRLRYLHVDGGHQALVLRHDLGLARALLAPGGIICLDDMLHAQYPELGTAVQEELAAGPELAVFCIVDRTDLIAAAKYLICGRAYAELYKSALRAAFPAYVFPEPAEFSAAPALILSKDAALVPAYRDLIEPPKP